MLKQGLSVCLPHSAKKAMRDIQSLEHSKTSYHYGSANPSLSRPSLFTEGLLVNPYLSRMIKEGIKAVLWNLNMCQ